MQKSYTLSFIHTCALSYINDMTQTNKTSYYNSSSMGPQEKPQVLLLGLKRSGKSSILKVVFNKMSPNETLFLEATNTVAKQDISYSSFVQFQLCDYPGQVDWFDGTFNLDSVFGGCSALVFVIDAQDDYVEALAKLHETIATAFRINPKISFEIFIHKVDGLSDEHKMETTRHIHHRVTEELVHAGLEEVHVSFYMTSIYDHSIFESFSKVVQKLIRQLPTLENLLNILNSNSGFDKSFLFDVSTKIYIATDSAPVDVQSYELCSDMIDVVYDVSCIYGARDRGSAGAGAGASGSALPAIGGSDDVPDAHSSSIIKLSNGLVLWFKGVATSLSLVCIMRQEHFIKQGIVEYNFHCFRQAIQEIFEARRPTLSRH